MIVGYIVTGEEDKGWRPAYGYFGTQWEIDPFNNKIKYSQIEWHLDENLEFNVLFPNLTPIQKGFPLRFSFLYNTDVTEITVTINGQVVEPNNDIFGEYRIHSVKEDKYVIDVKTNLYKESGVEQLPVAEASKEADIYDINGRMVLHTVGTNIENEAKSLAPGVYIIHTSSGTLKWIKK